VVDGSPHVESQTSRHALTTARAQAQLRLLLADDHPVLRAGLKALLSAEPDLKVVAEADTGNAAVELARTLRPDLVVMDVSLPGLNGAEATREIQAQRPELPVLALSVHEEVPFVRMLLDAGAGLRAQAQRLRRIGARGSHRCRW
jgi:CheY-like chemotaxis protein